MGAIDVVNQQIMKSFDLLQSVPHGQVESLNITTSQWAPRRLKSRIARLFAQPFQGHLKENNWLFENMCPKLPIYTDSYRFELLLCKGMI